MIVLRNLGFYLAFYFGSPFYVVAALLAGLRGAAGLRAVVARWAQFHRACLRLAGIRVVEEGAQATGPVLYAVRHESFFEAIDAPYLFQDPAPFAKQELSWIPGWGLAAS